jgi:hypothetical protein
MCMRLTATSEVQDVRCDGDITGTGEHRGLVNYYDKPSRKVVNIFSTGRIGENRWYLIPWGA